MMERVKVPTMSRLVAAMEAEALVRRERHGTDGRVVVLHATVMRVRCHTSWWSTSATEAPTRFCSCAFADRR